MDTPRCNARSKRLRRQSYLFYLASRCYYVADAVLALSALVCSSVAAGLASTGKDYNDTIVALGTTSAVIVGTKQFFSFSESSAVCRGISRDLDGLANEHCKGRIDGEKLDKRIATLRRRVPVGSCVILRY